MTKSIIISHNESQTSTANSTQHFSLGGARGTAGFWDVTHTHITWRQTGTLSNLRLYVIVESFTANSTFRTKKNGANGSQSVVFQATGAFEDTTNTDSVADGDEFTLENVSPASGTFLFTMAQCYFDYGSTGARNLLSPADATVDLASSTRYGPIHGQPDSADWGATENTSIIAEQRKSMLFENFQINRQDNTRTTTTTFRTRKNAANGACSIAFTTGTGIVEDTVNADGVVAGDNFNYQVVTGTGTQALRFYPAIFAGANASSISQYLVGRATGQARLGNIADHYEPIAGTLIPTAVTTEAHVQVEVPDSVIWSELTVTITANSMDSGENNLFTFRKNSAATSMVVTNLPGGTGVFSDSTNTVSTVVNDLVCHQVNPGGQSTDSVTIMSIAVWGTIDTSQDITRALPTETVSISEASLVRNTAKNRPITPPQTTSIAENVVRRTTKQRSIPVQTITIGETILRSKGKLKALATETVTVDGGILNRLAAKIRPISQTTVINESVIRRTAKNRAISAETITIGGGTVNRLKGAVKAIPTQTVTIGESVSRLLTKNRVISQTVTIGESSSRLANKNRTIAQTVVIAENVAKTVTAGAKNITRALATETVAVSESVMRLLAKSRVLSDTVPLSESVTRLKSAQRTLLQTITIGETLTRSKSVLRSLVTQSVPISESINRLTAKIRTLSETVTTAGESVSRLKAATRVIATETITLTESVSQTVVIGAVQITRSLTDTVVVLTDSVARLKAAQRFLSETVPTAGNVARTKEASKSIPQTVSIAEQLTRIKSSIKTLSETVLTSSVLNRSIAKLRTLTQSIAINETVQRAVTTAHQDVVRAITETVTIAEQSLVRQAAKSRVLLTETIEITEQLIHDRLPVSLGIGGIVGSGGGPGITRKPRGRPRNRQKLLQRPIGVAIIFVKTRVVVIVPILILHSKKKIQIKIMKMPIIIRVRYASLPIRPTPIAERRIFDAGKSYAVLKAASLLVPTKATFTTKKLNVTVNLNSIIKYDKLVKIIKLFKMYNNMG